MKIKYLILVFFFKRADYNTKISEIENKITTNHDHDKYITTQEFNKLTSENFTARLKLANLARKSDISNSVKKRYLNKSELNEPSKNLKQYQKQKINKRFDK